MLVFLLEETPLQDDILVPPDSSEYTMFAVEASSRTYKRELDYCKRKSQESGLDLETLDD